MGLISRVSSRTYREVSSMLRRTVIRLAKSPELGFPPSRAAFTEIKKDEPLENYASWDTQRYVNKGVCFYDLIDNMMDDRLPRDNAMRKKNRNDDGISK